MSGFFRILSVCHVVFIYSSLHVGALHKDLPRPVINRNRGLLTNYNGQFNNAPLDLNRLTFYVNDPLNYVNISQPIGVNVKNPSTILKTRISHAYPMRILIPGWFDMHNDTLWKNMATQFVLLDNVTVFRLDWSAGNQASYDQAMNNGLLVSKAVADWLVYMVNSFGLKPDDIQIIGHSLGAHVAGFAGKYLKTSSISLGRITGLDPAGPGFTGQSASRRLDSTDAKFVDTIMTGQDFGTTEPMGHYNFQPNGGLRQPGCSATAQTYGIDLCSHGRAIEYYTESIGNTNCRAIQNSASCASFFQYQTGACGQCIIGTNCAVMGDLGLPITQPVPVGQRLAFYMAPAASAPFCVVPGPVTLPPGSFSYF